MIELHVKMLPAKPERGQLTDCRIELVSLATGNRQLVS
jgi:hypothetical protein